MQKILKENVDMRQSGEGKSYGVISALAKSTNFKQIHELFVPGRLSAKFATSKDKFLLLKKDLARKKMDLTGCRKIERPLNKFPLKFPKKV